MIKKHILQKLKPVICIMLGLFLLVNVYEIVVCAGEVSEYVIYTEEAQAVSKLNAYDLYAGSAVLMDAVTGRVLYEKNGFEQMAMATKVLI